MEVFYCMSEEIDGQYRPSEDEPFMNERQKAYFRAKLVSWKMIS